MNKIITLKNLCEKLPKTLKNSPKSFHTFSKPPSIHHNSPCNSPTFTKNGTISNHYFSSFARFKTPTINSFSGSRFYSLRSQFPKLNSSSSSSHLIYNFKRNWNSWFQGYSTDNIVLGIILANAAVFVLWRVFNRDFMVKNFMISLDNLKSGRIHTLVTCAFSHYDMGHIISNMIGFYFFGSNIGRQFGPEYLLKLYLAGAVVGSLFYVVHHAFIAKMFQKQETFGRDSSRVPGLGASGAVNAIMLLDIFLFPKATIMFDFFIPVPAILLGIFLIGKDVLRLLEGDQQVSGSAHLGGAAVAAVAWLRLKKGRGFRF